MLIFVPRKNSAVFFARMVMPRSRSSSFESITRSTTASLARKVPLCCSMASTSVVLPWSTCAMMAMLRILELKVEISLIEDAARRSAQAASTTVLWRPQSGGSEIADCVGRKENLKPQRAQRTSAEDRGDKLLRAGTNIACRAYSKQLDHQAES